MVAGTSSFRGVIKRNRSDSKSKGSPTGLMKTKSDSSIKVPTNGMFKTRSDPKSKSTSTSTSSGLVKLRSNPKNKTVPIVPVRRSSKRQMVPDSTVSPVTRTRSDPQPSTGFMIRTQYENDRIPRTQGSEDLTSNKQAGYDLVLDSLKRDVAAKANPADQKVSNADSHQLQDGTKKDTDQIDNPDTTPPDPLPTTQEWFVNNLCVRPGNALTDEDRNDTNDCGVGNILCGQTTNEKNSSEDYQEDREWDGDSGGSVSTLGRMFGDLVSLPSVPDGDNDDKFSVGDLSAISGDEIKIAPSGDSLGLQMGQKSHDNFDTENSQSVNVRVDELIESRDTAPQGYEVVPVDQAKSSDSQRANDPENSLESRLQALVVELRRSMEKFGRYDIRCANVAAALGDVFDEDKEFDQALQAYQEAAMVYSVKLGDHHVTTLDTKIRVGKLMEKTGAHNDAMYMYFSVLQMRQALLGERHSSVSDMLALISMVLDKKGKTTKAIKELKRALKMYRESLGDAHPRVATTVDQIAALYMKTEDHHKASAILEEVVKLRAATMGLNHPEVARSLMELASAQEASGDYAKAMKSLKKSHAIYAETENPKSPNTLLALERVAKNHKARNEPEKAIATYVRVLRGRKHTLGERDPLVAKTYLNLGILLRETGENERGLKCMKHALAVYTDEGKGTHDLSMITETMHEIAILHASTNHMTEACKVLKQEISLRQKIGTSELPRIAKTLNYLGVLEYEMKNHTRALNCFMESLSILEKTEGMGVDFGEALFNTGLALKASGHPQRASEAFLEALNIFRSRGLTDDHQLVVKATLELKRMQCKCQKGNCDTIPCKSSVVKC